MDQYISDCAILKKEAKMPKVYPKVYRAFLTICNDLMELEHEK